MNSKTYKPKNKREELLLSITKSTDVFDKQTQAKAKKTKEFKINKLIVSSSFDTRLNLQD